MHNPEKLFDCLARPPFKLAESGIVLPKCKAISKQTRYLLVDQNGNEQPGEFVCDSQKVPKYRSLLAIIQAFVSKSAPVAQPRIAKQFSLLRPLDARLDIGNDKGKGFKPSCLVLSSVVGTNDQSIGMSQVWQQAWVTRFDGPDTLAEDIHEPEAFIVQMIPDVRQCDVRRHLL